MYCVWKCRCEMGYSGRGGCQSRLYKAIHDGELSYNSVRTATSFKERYEINLVDLKKMA